MPSIVKQVLGVLAAVAAVFLWQPATGGAWVAMGDGAVPEFDGSKSCKKCHSATYKSWEETPHGKAFDSLKPGQAAEVKAKFNLDPAKDYTTDETCLKCHTVGFGAPGGYAIPDPADAKAVRQAAKLEGVGCESCHGPGAQYNDLFAEIKKSQRKYKLEELTPLGLIQPVTEATCVTCHNAESPTRSADTPFDFEEMKKKGVHTHETLTQREGAAGS